MSKTSISMMSNTQSKWDVIGEPVRADGWYGMTDGLHTIAATVVGFIGELIIEASIASEPQDGDWFSVDCGCKSSMSFPIDPNSLSTSDTVGFNVVGSFVWLRARISRKKVGPEPLDESIKDGYGYVDRILINI